MDDNPPPSPVRDGERESERESDRGGKQQATAPLDCSPPHAAQTGLCRPLPCLLLPHLGWPHERLRVRVQLKERIHHPGPPSRTPPVPCARPTTRACYVHGASGSAIGQMGAMEAHPSAQSMPPLAEGSISISGLFSVSPSHLTPLGLGCRSPLAGRTDTDQGKSTRRAKLPASAPRSLSAHMSGEAALPKKRPVEIRPTGWAWLLALAMFWLLLDCGVSRSHFFASCGGGSVVQP